MALKAEAEGTEKTQMSSAQADPTRRLYIKLLIGSGLFGLFALPLGAVDAQVSDMLIDDFSNPGLLSKLGTRWRGVSDQVMGGVSEATVGHDTIDSRPCLRLSGDVRLENNGGFIQAALDLALSGENLDASDYAGLRLVVRGNGERYSVHFRTPDNIRPWQSYRAHFTVGPNWETIYLPFSAFVPYRLEAPLDITRLRRIGLVAIGRAFAADLMVSELSFYR